MSMKQTHFVDAHAAKDFCKSFDLDISLDNEQLFDIADALHNAANAPAYADGYYLRFSEADEFVSCVNQLRNDQRKTADDAVLAVNSDPMTRPRVQAVVVNT